MGLAIPLSKFSFQFVADRLNGFELHPELGDDANNWQFRRMLMAHRYRVALALNTDTKFELKGFHTIPLQGSTLETLNFL